MGCHCSHPGYLVDYVQADGIDICKAVRKRERDVLL